MVQFPNKLYELDAAGKPVHWSPYNGQVLPGRMFAGTGFWDTFRALYPFLNLMYPSVNREMQEGLANDFKEGGWLPEWSSPGYANVMIGNNSASVVAEAWLKGLRGYDIETLWQALVHGAEQRRADEAVGRAGVEDYKRLGLRALRRRHQRERRAHAGIRLRRLRHLPARQGARQAGVGDRRVCRARAQLPQAVRSGDRA
jgi:putative alpha-1,2-mannosidase